MTKCIWCCNQLKWDTVVCPKCERRQFKLKGYYQHIHRFGDNTKQVRFNERQTNRIFKDKSDFAVSCVSKLNNEQKEDLLIDRVVNKVLFNYNLTR